MLLTVIVVGIVSYLIGSINFSILLSRAVGGKDIRTSGSGNAGATNMLRTYGKKMGVITLMLDILKGVVCVLIARAAAAAAADGDMATVTSAAYIAGVCVVLGHNFPLYFGFKGGKGVATSLGVVLILDWKVGLAVAVIAILIMAATRYVSLGSIIGGAAFIIVEIAKAIVTENVNAVKIICVIIIGGLLIVRHHANIQRLLNGTESKLGSKAKEDSK